MVGETRQSCLALLELQEMGSAGFDMIEAFAIGAVSTEDILENLVQLAEIVVRSGQLKHVLEWLTPLRRMTGSLARKLRRETAHVPHVIMVTLLWRPASRAVRQRRLIGGRRVHSPSRE